LDWIEALIVSAREGGAVGVGEDFLSYELKLLTVCRLLLTFF
jgi:hypothetical protein